MKILFFFLSIVLVNAEWDTLHNLIDSEGYGYNALHATLLPDGMIMLLGFRNVLDDYSSCGQNQVCGSQNIAYILDTTNFSLHSMNYGGLGWEDGHTVCAGHTMLQNGDVIHFGGNGNADFVRYYSSSSNVFSMSKARRSPIGDLYYSTATRIRNGLVFVYANLLRGAAASKPQYLNYATALYDPRVDFEGGNPWEIFWNASDTVNNHGPILNTIGYTSVWTLKHPVTQNDVVYDLAAIGDAYRFVFINSYNSSQTYMPENGERPDLDGLAPGCTKQFGYQSSVMLENGDLAIAGGCLGSTASHRIHVYNPTLDSWNTIELGMARGFASFVLFPDGTALFMNGRSFSYFEGNPRVPQLINFTSGVVTNLIPEPQSSSTNYLRGYHNWAILLNDGRVLTGGGLEQGRKIGCEWQNARIFLPPYLINATRPVFVNFTLISMDTLSIYYEGIIDRIVAMTLPSFTHQIDTNMRLIRLEIISDDGHVLLARFPYDTEIILPGQYMIFLISDIGTPSISIMISFNVTDTHGYSETYSMFTTNPTATCLSDPSTKNIIIISTVTIFSSILVILVVYCSRNRKLKETTV